MSCGARLTVYALFAAAFFPENGQNIVFGLYLFGIALAIFTGWTFRKQLFTDEITPSFKNAGLPRSCSKKYFVYNVVETQGFMFRAGKTIVIVVIALSFLNSIGSDGSFGNEDSALVLSVVGKTITPIFAPSVLKKTIGQPQ